MEDRVQATPVERDEIQVLYVRAPDGVAGIRSAWERLESLVGTRGRKFYGAFYPETEEYRACVEAAEGDDAAGLGLESAELPGGRYLRARLRGEPPAVYDLIQPTFEQLLRQGTGDASRPSLEHYRRRDEIDLLLPVSDR